MLYRIAFLKRRSGVSWQISRKSSWTVGLILSLLVSAGMVPERARATEARSVAFLGVHLLNDNEAIEPTSDAERARMKKVEELFKSSLEASGRFMFVTVPPDVRAKIAAGQAIGECGGCEIDYGKSAGGKEIAWIRVQKISNLILNMNVYMADVATQKMTFLHSVDIRGNTDESWIRSINFLVKNYLLVP
ncbi:MAG: DUF3280 domain-containing protein [Hyphomicrobiaceae bacterium]